MTGLIVLGVLAALAPWLAGRQLQVGRRAALRKRKDHRARARWLTKFFPTFFKHLETADEPPAEALLHQIAGLLGGGMPVDQAWQSLAVGTTEEGLPRLEDLIRALEPIPTPDTARQAQGVLVACKLAHELGIPLAGLLIVVAGTIEDSHRSIAQRERALAGPAATSRVLLGLPLIGIFLGAALGAQPLSWLLGGPLGWLSTGGGVALLLAGRKWSRSLMAKAVVAGTAP